MSETAMSKSVKSDPDNQTRDMAFVLSNLSSR